MTLSEGSTDLRVLEGLNLKTDHGKKELKKQHGKNGLEPGGSGAHL